MKVVTMKCPYMYKDCKVGCDNHVCRAFFPERQPIISKLTKDICTSDDYETECLQYIDGTAWREKKRLAGLKEKCPFASNTICGRPWEWWCKGGQIPFLLTTYEEQEGKPRIPVRDEAGNIKFTRTTEDIYETCLSGDASIYTRCPSYKLGVEAREYDRNLKSQKNSE